MLKTGILNPRLNDLLSRVRHTNTLVIPDRGFPFWSMIETVDVSVVDDLPGVLQLLAAIRPNFHIGKAWMAEEFLKHNHDHTRAAFAEALKGIDLKHEPHMDLKKTRAARHRLDPHWRHGPIRQSRYRKRVNDVKLSISVVVRRLSAAFSSKNVGVLISLNTPKDVDYECN